MQVNYDGKRFRGAGNTANGEVSDKTLFHYHQEGNLLSGEYSGGSIRTGSLLGLVREDGSLDFLYHHIHESGELQAGRCRSTPHLTDDGRIELEEAWQWLTGDKSAGTSVVIEVRD